MIKTLFFDIGETILDTGSQMDALMEVHRNVLEDFGFPISQNEYRQLDDTMTRSFVPSAMHAITWHFAKPDKGLHDDITGKIRSHYDEIRQIETRLYPAVDRLLEMLADDFTLGLAGNAPASVLKSLDRFGVLRWFTHTDVSGSIGIKKPDQRFFETILANADTTATEAIMIGDRLDKDIIPARQIGMHTVWIRWGRYRIMEPRTPDEIPDATVADVRKVLVITSKGKHLYRAGCGYAPSFLRLALAFHVFPFLRRRCVRNRPCQFFGCRRNGRRHRIFHRTPTGAAGGFVFALRHRLAPFYWGGFAMYPRFAFSLRKPPNV